LHEYKNVKIFKCLPKVKQGSDAKVYAVKVHECFSCVLLMQVSNNIAKSLSYQ